MYISAVFFWFSIIFVFYTYAGYPLLAYFFTYFYKQKQASEVVPGSVTVLITAYNEEIVIAKKIQNTLDLDYPADKLQIIVAADGSSDNTPEIVRQFDKRVELSYIPPRQGKMAAINRAISMVRGDIIVFSDANNMYEPDAIKKLVAPFSDSTVGATTGAKIIIQDGGDLSTAEGIYWKYESWIKVNQTKLDTCTSSVGEMLAVRREYYLSPPNNIINDDYYIVIDLIRRGYRVCYLPEARSMEYISATEKDEITRRTRISTGHYQAMFMAMQLLPFRRPWAVWHIISHKFCRALVPFAFISAFLSNLFVCLFSNSNPASLLFLTSPYAQLFLACQLLFYGLAVIGNIIKIPGVPGKLIYLCTYLVNSNYALLRGFWGYITKKQTNLWQRVRRENI
jgi:cellulose synthase/poly-beta-1,6-N-acetylglucosamine synthase-like glycosyltransferase